MTDHDTERLNAWGQQMRAVHQRLRDALDIARDTIEAGGTPESLTKDLALYCGGFCFALTGHHGAEDADLFPRVLAEHPELAPTVAQLVQDHSMISYLIQGMERALRSTRDATTLLRHLDGIGAIMESHFRYEETQLVSVLDGMTFENSTRAVLFGPLA
jgi:hemerythrin-like domain-containing protein